MSLIRRDFIINKFEERFGKRYIWDRFKNKIDISRKVYIKVKKLIYNRIGFVYDVMGRLQMLDVWWDDCIKVINFFLFILFNFIYICEFICLFREVYVYC